MVRWKFFSLALAFSILIVGCTPEQKITKLQEEANTLVKEEKFDEAISKYDEIVKLKDDEVYKKEVSAIQEKKNKKEQEYKLIEQMKQYRTTLISIQREKLAMPKDEIKFIDLHYILQDIKPIFDFFGTVNLQPDSEINKYVLEVKRNQDISRIVLKNDFSEDYATSSQRARNKDIAMPVVGGELGAALKGLETLDKLQKNFLIDNLDKYANDLLKVNPPGVLQ